MKQIEAIQAKAAHAKALLQEPENPTNRAALLYMISKAISYHKSGKIEGLHSLDTACSNCQFCQHMQESTDPRTICALCYTRSMWSNAKQAHAITGEILSSVLFTAEELATISAAPGYIRINSDGELINVTHAANIVRFVASHPANTVTIWTKRPDLLNRAIKEEGKPANMICGVSSPLINHRAEAAYNWIDFIFTVYTPNAIPEALKRGERPCNGRKCKDCKYQCYKHNTQPSPVYVAEALKRPRDMKKEQFCALIQRIDAATTSGKET